MNKKEEYLESLEYYLKEFDFAREEREEVLDDYAIMIDEANENNETYESLEELLGSPREIVRNLRKTMVIKRVKSNKFVALSPFIATIMFFILGFGFELWHPGWLVFLLIPISGVLSSKRKSDIKTVIEVMPFIAILIFLIIGLNTGVWHPTWAVFLIIPASAMVDNRLKYRYISMAAFVLITLIYVLSVLFFPFAYNWLIMLFLFFPAYYSGFISFRINGKRNRKLELILTLTIFSSLIIFFLLGFLLDLWHPAWLVFLSIPVVSMIASAKFFNKKLPFVAVTPFIALVGFFLAGEILDGYHWSWLFFLMIPMAGILNDR